MVVVGGGAAGLSGAIALARSRRRVLVVDAGRARATPPPRGCTTCSARRDSPRAELVARGRDELRGYGGEVRDGTAVAADARPETASWSPSTTVTGSRARRLLVTTGLVDELPEVPGVRERWGHQVLHCPYCHGWEVRDQRIGVLATSPAAVHQALLFSQLSDDVIVLAHTGAPVDRTTGRGSRRPASRSSRARSPRWWDRGRTGLAGVRLEDGSRRPARRPRRRPADGRARSAVLDSLGLAPADHPSGMGEHVPERRDGPHHGAGRVGRRQRHRPQRAGDGRRRRRD